MHGNTLAVLLTLIACAAVVGVIYFADVIRPRIRAFSARVTRMADPEPMALDDAWRDVEQATHSAAIWTPEQVRHIRELARLNRYQNGEPR